MNRVQAIFSRHGANRELAENNPGRRLVLKAQLLLDLIGLIETLEQEKIIMGRESDVITGLLSQVADLKTKNAALQTQLDAAPDKDAADLAAEQAGADELGLPPVTPVVPVVPQA